MPAPTLADIQALPDILSTDKYLINFGTVPGGGGDTSRLSLTCTSLILPGSSIEPIEQSFAGGHTRKFNGRRMFSRTASIEFTEHADTRGLQIMRNWLEFCRGTNSGGAAGYMDDISVTAEVQVFDTTEQLADYCRIYRFWPQEMGDITLASDGSTAMKASVTMSYDYVEYANVALR